MNKLQNEYAGFIITTHLNLDRSALQNWLHECWPTSFADFLVTEKAYTGCYCYYITYPIGRTWYGKPLTTDVIYERLEQLEQEIEGATRQEDLLKMLRA